MAFIKKCKEVDSDMKNVVNDKNENVSNSKEEMDLEWKYECLEGELWMLQVFELYINSDEIITLGNLKGERKAFYCRERDVVIIDEKFFEDAEWKELYYVAARELKMMQLWKILQSVKVKKNKSNVGIKRRIKLWKQEFKFYDSMIAHREPMVALPFTCFDIELEAHNFAKNILKKCEESADE